MHRAGRLRTKQKAGQQTHGCCPAHKTTYWLPYLFVVEFGRVVVDDDERVRVRFVWLPVVPVPVRSVWFIVSCVRALVPWFIVPVPVEYVPLLVVPVPVVAPVLVVPVVPWFIVPVVVP